MKIQYKNINAQEATNDVVILGCLVDEKTTKTLQTLDKNSEHFFSQAQENGFFPVKAGEIRTFYQVPSFCAKQVALIAYEPTQKGLVKAAKTIQAYLRNHKISDASVALIDEDFDGLSIDKKARLFTQNLLDADYVCEQYKSEKEERTTLSIDLIAADSEKTLIKKGIHQGTAIATGMNTLKDLGNAPGNICTPKYLAKRAKKLAKEFSSLSVKVLKEKEIKKLKMEALLSVSKGSVEKPHLIKLEHKGGKGDPIIFVGKGVTFDTGGISLKPGAGMDEMKYDMCGAGSVIGLMQAVAMMKLPINVIGIIPAVENMPSGCATKPGDIVTSMSGKTIEVLNTDAEGRMILCDALTYAQQFKPKALIDLATLTGAVIIALGRHPSGLMSNNDELAQQLTKAGDSSGDRVWRLPIWEDYVEQLKSPFADLQNIGGREAGSITAGCFLGEFTKDVPWAHLDIAATAWQTRKEGATGRPVPLLVEYLFSQL